MAEEPQFHLTVVTQKRRRVERSESSRGRDPRRSDAPESSRSETRGTQNVSAGEGSAAAPGAARTVSAAETSGAPLEGMDRKGTAVADKTENVTAQTRANRIGKADPAGSGSAAPTRSGSRHRGSHQRRYLDYGTVDLGSLGDAAEEERDFTDDPNGPTPSQGELQRQFYRKYDAILNRRYLTRNRTNVTRIVIVTLLVALIVVIGLFAISSFTGNDAETLERPEISTIPVETIDLG